MESKIIFTSKNETFRIIELPDRVSSVDDLKGDTFNPTVNSDIPLAKLAREERAFEEKVENEGLYGYALEKWNPAPGKGWEHVDSCFGFVGQFDAKSNAHYIVDEMKQTIAEKA